MTDKRLTWAEMQEKADNKMPLVKLNYECCANCAHRTGGNDDWGVKEHCKYNDRNWSFDYAELYDAIESTTNLYTHKCGAYKKGDNQ